MDYDWTMQIATENGHIEIVRLCREWGAIDYDRAMCRAAENGHDEIVKLCREWLCFEAIHDELYRYHHKKKCFKSLHDEVLAIGWHPDRWRDWCLTEDEKKGDVMKPTMAN